MAKQAESGLYKCEVCNMKYRTSELAEKCEEWCKEHPSSCNAEVSAQAVEE